MKAACWMHRGAIIYSEILAYSLSSSITWTKTSNARDRSILFAGFLENKMNQDMGQARGISARSLDVVLAAMW